MWLLTPKYFAPKVRNRPQGRSTRARRWRESTWGLGQAPRSRCKITAKAGRKGLGKIFTRDILEIRGLRRPTRSIETEAWPSLIKRRARRKIRGRSSRPGSENLSERKGQNVAAHRELCEGARQLHPPTGRAHERTGRAPGHIREKSDR